ncbi:hypothetical protein BVRB_8g199590 [Beta vulgaris subsp. vulgaris]|uniref:Uncharacterized protein n=1 Tax=Beta vulgaris subsp. vulgaris TaxID=3555 RepID=A0A0J8B6Z8_BETVV|nr:hypothetical protein BVRB_8g199590 [Beta vulgaris subsp. vulgaris]
MALAGGGKRMSNGGSESQRSTSPSPSPGRLIPKRGQVKGRIVKGLANSVVAAIFSLATNSHRRSF